MRSLIEEVSEFFAMYPHKYEKSTRIVGGKKDHRRHGRIASVDDKADVRQWLEGDRVCSPACERYGNTLSERQSSHLFCVLRVRAASMNETNSGCGFMGRDLNSGWNWHPRNQG